MFIRNYVVILNYPVLNFLYVYQDNYSFFSLMDNGFPLPQKTAFELVHEFIWIFLGLSKCGGGHSTSGYAASHQTFL